MPHTLSDTCEFLYTLIESDYSGRIFGPDFQSYGDFCSYLEENFGPSYDIHNVWKTKKDNAWSEADFQALYVACWIYKPMEKGTYFVRMTPSEARQVKKGFEKLSTRKSSHLDGKGRSAHKGWKFLKGYKELLVQWHKMRDRDYLLLKAEGHTTGMSGIAPHMKSWWHKKKTGAGLMANQDLNDLAQIKNSPIVARGAENFSNDYKDFLKTLGKARGNKKLANATTSVRDMLSTLTGKNWSAESNLNVKNELERLAKLPKPTKINGVDVSDAVKQQFLRFAKLFELENRPDAVYERFFEEVHVNPDQLSNAIKEFKDWDLPISTISQTQRRSAMHRY